MPGHSSIGEKVKIHSLSFAFACVLITGCSAIKHNVVVTEPADGDRARIRVVIPNIDYRGVRAYPNSACVNGDLPGAGMVASVQMSLGFEKNLNEKKIGMPTTTYSKNNNYMTAEIYAAANQPITFSINKPALTVPEGGGYVRIYPKTACSNAVSFTPEANGDYELVFSDELNCPATVQKLTVGQQHFEVTPVESQVAKRCERRN
jgi:hypothetical protein